MRRDVLIRIENGTIVAVRRMRLEDQLALEDRLLVCSESTVLPGLIDAHAHPTFSGTGDEAIRQKQLSYTLEQAFPVIRSHLTQSLACGIVAVRDGGDASAHTLSFVRDPDRFTLPIQVRAAGKAWRSRGRYGRLIGRPPAEGMTLADAVASDPSGPDHVKIVSSGVNSLKEFGRETRPQFSSAELEGAITAARKRGLKVMVHANGATPVRDAVDAGAASIEHGFFMGRSNLERMADLQVFWVPTAITMKAYAQELPRGGLEAEIAWRTLEHQMGQIELAGRLGVPVVVGTDSGSLGVHHGQAVRQEMEILLESGYAIEEAVCCATQDASRLLGLRREMGQIKKGMDATFVVVGGPPDTLIRHMERPERVYVRGRLVSSAGGMPAVE